MQQGGGPIFAQQTLKRTRATDEARLVLHNIQTRHNDILRIEKTVIVGSECRAANISPVLTSL